MSSRKVTGLPLPETPREAPPEIHGLVDAIEAKLGDSKVMEAASALGRAFDYLTRYFAAVAGVTAQVLELGGEATVAADFETARTQLKERLVLLGEKSTDPASKLVRAVFFVGATRKTPTPRRHARLLDLGGIPIRGYLSLGDWIALTPGENELATDSKANRELLRYLPILKEWVTATATFFLDTEQSPLTSDGGEGVNFDFTIAETKKVAGPVLLPEELRTALSSHIVKSKPAAPSVDEQPEPPAETSPQVEAEPAAPVQAEQAPPVQAEPVSPVADPSPSEPVEAQVAKPPTPRAPVTEPPKIEVVGVEPREEKPKSDPPQLEDSGPAAPVPESVPVSAPVGPQAPVMADAPTMSVPQPELPPPPPVAQAIKSPDVPDSLALPDPTTAKDPVEPTVPKPDMVSPQVDPPSSAGKAVTEALSLPTDIEDKLESPGPVGVPEPKKPDEAELADPVIAALNKPKPEKKAKPEPPVLELYPVVTGPPPEFFDEIDVEEDFPELLVVALTDLNGAIESNDSRLICGQMQRCFDVMIQFFAGMAGAILFEIDEEALFDFDVEDGRFDLEVKIDLIVTALSALEEYWEGHDAANLIWSVFYDTLLPATDPNCAYLHTRLLGVEGLVPDPFLEFSELCQIVPGHGKLESQEQCRQVSHHYLPILAFWLENAMPLFLECDVDFVEEDDGKALSWAATVGGLDLDGTASGYWLEIASDRWNLPRPEMAPVFVTGDAPEALLPVVDELNTALETGDMARAGLYTRVSLDFLVQYFTGCAASLWRQQGHMTEQALSLFYPAASLAEKERLLILSLGGVSTDSEVGSSLGKLFSKGSLQYRVLTQRGQPAGMKLISDWAASREEVSEAELLLYLPLLRSWIGAANPWFSAGEQLFEEPSPDGVLEGVVAYGDEFLEMVDPEYVVQLARECLELVAPFDEEEEEEEELDQKADSPFTGKLPQLPILTEGPPVLVGHVTRLLESANDRRTSNAWLGSSFEYLIQYFAGLCVTVLGGKQAPIDRKLMAHFSPEASLRQRELLLVACVEHLKTAATGSVQEAVRDIFLKPDGSYRSHTKYLGCEGAGSLGENEMLLSFWCRARHQAGHLTTSDLHFGTSVLNSWLDSAKPFFASCEHYAEDPGVDGQEEMVVELADDYLDMVLPDYAIQIPARGYYELLYKETDAEARADVEVFFPEDIRPDLLGPQEVVLGGAASGAGDELLGAAVDLGGGDGLFAGAADGYDSDELFAGSSVTQKLDADDMFSGAAPAPEAETPKAPEKTPEVVETAKVAPPEPEKRKKKKKRSKKQELGSAVLELYKKERLEKARKRAEARARKAEEAPTQLKISMEYRGLKNSEQLGGRGHFGLIELSNIGGGELKGTVEPSHPCVKVKPTRFEGNQVRVVYQVDPSDMPSTGRTGLTINTQDERLAIRLDRLVPSSWWRERTTMEALGVFLTPSFCYLIWLLLLLGVFLGPGLEREFESFGRNAKLESLPWGTHMKAWLFAMLAILPGASAIPAGIKWLFAKFDYTVQEESKWALIPTMMLPTVVMAILMYGTKFWVFKVPPTRLPLLANRLVITIITFGLNLLATSLFSLQTTIWWEDNSDSQAAKRTFMGFWIGTVLLGVVVTFFMW